MRIIRIAPIPSAPMHADEMKYKWTFSSNEKGTPFPFTRKSPALRLWLKNLYKSCSQWIIVDSSPPLSHLVSSLHWSHDGTSEGIPTRDPTTSTSGSRLYTSSTKSDNQLTSPPMWPTHERIFLKTSICVFKEGSPPLENDNKCSSLKSVWLILN